MPSELTGSAEFQAWGCARKFPQYFAAQTSGEAIMADLSQRFKIERWQQKVERMGRC
jgi:hypothetical protein